MNEFNLDDFLMDFEPYFLSLRDVNEYKIIDVEVPNDWDVGKTVQQLIKTTKIQTVLTEKTEKTKMIAIVGHKNHHTFNVLFAQLETIIKANKEREEKNKLFRLSVKKLEQLFLNSELNQLQKLVIDVEDETEDNDNYKLGKTDNVNLTQQEIINEDSDEDVLNSISKKKDLVQKVD